LGPSRKTDATDTEERGFKTPTLPSEEMTIPKEPSPESDNPSPQPIHPKGDEESKVVERPAVKLRRKKQVQPRRIPAKSYADLVKGKFIVNFSSDISNYTAAPFIAECQKALHADEESVLIYLSSRGGIVDDGVRLYEQIRMLNTIKRVDILVSGYCYSACVWALMAVPLENRWISINSRVVIHPVFTNDSDGKVIPRSKLDRDQSRQQDWLNDRWIVQEIAHNSDIRRSDLRRLVDRNGRDVTLSAEKAVSLGIFAGVV
jgi:ATP-dependent protease ClpP protease subunit